MSATGNASDLKYLRLALRLARRGYGRTSPNPMVGAVLVKRGRIIGRGWHRRAGGPHAEIEALRDARQNGHSALGATLYVTLEPCCTHGSTPPCTDAIIAAGIERVMVAAVDQNPKHGGRALRILRRAGIEVLDASPAGKKFRGSGPSHLERELQALAAACVRLNEAFNHWIIHRTPFVTVKAATTLDGKIATASGESKWITGQQARAHAMKLRQGSDAILVGVNTVLADDPALTVRRSAAGTQRREKPIRRIVLDSLACTPLTAKVVSDEHATSTTIVVSKLAPEHRVAALGKRVKVIVAPLARSRNAVGKPKVNLRWLLRMLGSENVTSLLVEGGGEVNASFLLGGLVQRVAFFYAPRILGGRKARKAVAGLGVGRMADAIELLEIEWRRLGPDLLLQARVRS